MLSADPTGVDPDCGRCRHHLITHDPGQPRGCRAYGFITRALPSQVIHRESGMPCQKFEARGGPGDGSSGVPVKRKPGGLYG